MGNLKTRRNIYKRVAVRLVGGVFIQNAFVDGRVIFTNNPIALVGVVFENCVFEFPVTDKPVPDYENLANNCWPPLR